VSLGQRLGTAIAGTSLGRLGRFVRPHRPALVRAIVLSVVGQALAALLPLLQKVILDDSIIRHRRPLLPWISLLVAVGSVSLVLQYVRRFGAARVSLNLQHDLRLAIHRHVNSLDLARHDRLSIGDVMSRAASDVTLIQAFVNQIPLLAANLTLLLVAGVVMLALSPLLSVVFLIFVPLFLILAVRFRDQVFPASWNDQRLSGAVAGVVDEAVSGVRVVKAFAQERRELALLIDRARELFRSRLRTARLTALYSATLQAIPTLAQLGVLAFGGWLALRHHITLGVFLAFSSYLVQLLAPVRLLSGMLASSQQARAGAERVLELLNLQPIVQERIDARPLGDGPGAVELEQLTFAHTPGEPVLRDLTLRIAPGERLGVIGASGSGKSTLALLIARFYDPQQGTIRIERGDIRGYTLDSLRRNVGVVFEETFLFSTTVRENIAFGRPDATTAEVEAAARVADAHDFISALPHGYETRLGERGYTLSGGQRQRVALARAALANPRILILDDATSAVDARTEETIHHAFEETLGSRTTILIAHRQSTLRLATRVVVLEAGRVVAEGTNEELAATCSLYRELLLGREPESDAAASAPRSGRSSFLSTNDQPDAAAWPAHLARRGEERTLSVNGAIDLVSSKVGGGARGGGGSRDLGGNHAAFVAATPALLAKVAALPPLREGPSANAEAATAPEEMTSLARLVRPFRVALLVGLLLVVVDALTTLCGPFITGRAIDHGIAARDGRALAVLSALFLAVQLLSWLNARAMQLQTARTAENLLFSLRARTFAHLQRLSLDFYDREMGGRIMTRMTTDVEALAQLLQQGLLTAVVSLLGCAGVMVALFGLEPRLALAAFVVLPALVIGTALFRRWSAEAYLRARERISAVYAELQESLAGVRVTQAWARQAHSHGRFAALSSSYRDARLRSMQLVALYFPFLQFLSVVGKSMTLGVGAALIGRGHLTAGVLVAFLLYLDQFFTPLQQLSNVFDQWIQARVSLARIRELLATKTGTPETAAPLAIGRLHGEIRFEGVRFAYRNGPEALRGVDLQVRPGETVALVGTTGAGKSTFVKLLARFYDVTAGRVLVDGLPLDRLSLHEYRRQLGYVPQEPFLFSGTVRSNIAYGRPNASDWEVERAARAVGAHAVMAALPNGYLTAVTQGGRSLSAGQRQLICLARAELVDPTILILDEATSNLDLATEARVQRAMRLLSRGRTTLLIAHRLQTARAADRIVVLEEGVIVEQGPHAELLALGGRYAGLWQAFVQASVPPATRVLQIHP
jgi:ABC-type multidrug transport system fused ATPase/permease subunit